ncbi:hypothetical protein RHSP_64218 [Rhizobium freirei PRF 81]|uniref:Uncharacterized protein n=1 Tax=Rhizobium freirei PRF 81 TaxID=363754 RepID=N6UY17_9HYPH|nr:hypothetical protein [Rhizobium freirei]ENN86545.1 hypothetical protein RHSP_64218 [Rhizobium freirei PRF 81]
MVRIQEEFAAQPLGRSVGDLDLPSWLVDDAKALQEHPSFHAALRLYAELVTENFEKTYALTRIISEEARYMISVAWLAMHHSRDPHDPSSGATTTRLQAFAARFGLAGPNRVAALVAIMRHAGWLQQRHVASDRRIKLIEPTARGLAVAEAMTVATLRPMQLLSNEHDYLQIMRADPEFVGRYYAESMRLYESGCRIALALPEFDLFGKQNAGREVMFKLWIAMTNKGPVEPTVVSCAYNQLAKSFGVSRGHIRRMIEKGQGQGLFVVRAPGGQAIEILPRFIHLHLTLTSLEFALMIRAANAAAATSGRAERVF